MKLSFERLTIENFKCFTGKPITLVLNQRPIGLHFVRGINELEPALGSNGAGKSSLWDAVSWCLYGRTPDGLRNPDVTPWLGDPKIRVVLEILCDTKPYVVERRTRPNRLLVNDEDVGQDQIDHDLMSFSVFTHTILLGQSQPLFFDLSPRDKMELFVEVLGLDRWDDWAASAASETARLVGQETNETARLQTAQSLVKEVTEARRDLRKRSTDWEETKTSRLSELQKEVRTRRRGVKRLTTELGLVGERLGQTNEKVVALRETVVELKGDITELKDQIRKHENDLDQGERTLAKLQRDQEKLQKSKVCPTCGQTVKPDNLKKHLREIGKQIERWETFVEAGLSQDMVDALDTAEKKLPGAERRLKKLEVTATAQDKKLRELITQHASADAGFREQEKFLRTMSEQANPYADQLKETGTRLRKHKQDVVEIKEALKKLRARTGRVRFWVEGFKACRLYALEEVLEELKLVSNELGPELGLEDWQLDYSVEKETKKGSIKRGLSVFINSPEQEDVVRWESYSGGERQRLRLVGALALSEVLLNHAGIEVDWEVLDEPTQHLSMEGIRDLCALLPSRARRLNRRTFYTDHQAVESPYFSSTIIVSKTSRGISIAGGDRV